MTQHINRDTNGQFRRPRPWETARVHSWAIAYAMNGDAAAYVNRFYDGIAAVIGDEVDFPYDSDLPAEQLPGDGIYRLIIGGYVYYLDMDRVFKSVPNAPRWRVRGRLLSGPQTAEGKYPLVALTLAQFQAARPEKVQVAK